MLAGCSTIQTTPMRKVSEGAEIPGTDKYEIRVSSLSASMQGPIDAVAIVPSSITRHYSVRQYEEQWNEVTRRRYVAVAGVDKQYHVFMDIFGDPLMGVIFLPIFTPALPFAIFSSDGRKDFIPPLAGGYVGLLPLVNWAPEPPINETVKQNIRKTSLQNIDKQVMASSDKLNGKAVKWKVYRVSDGYIKGVGQVKWPQPIGLPLCDWVLDDLLIPSLRIELSSDDLILSGTTTWNLDGETNLHTLAERRWPDPASRPAFHSEVQFVRWLDHYGNPLQVLKSGQKGAMEIQLCNLQRATPSYLLNIRGATNGGSAFISWADVPSVKYLPGNSSTNIRIPFRIPARLPEPASTVDMVAVDIFGRKTPACIVNMPLRQLDFPQFGIYTAVVRSRGGKHELVLDVRNRGRGEANQVMVTLEQLPPGLAVEMTQQGIPRIPPYSRHQAVFPLAGALPVGIYELALRVQITEELELPPTVIDIKAAVMATP